MINLIPEIVSPNVTKIKPMYLPTGIVDIIGDGCTMKDLYEITNHGNGIFEFNIQIDEDTKSAMGERINLDFAEYEKDDAVYNVSVTGLPTDSGIGSKRFCTMNATLASWITETIKGRCAIDIFKDEYNSLWEFVQASQYFRFMKYENGGEHFPHYDSDYKHVDNTHVSKYSVVMYFTDCETGDIAFCFDDRENNSDSVWDSDWDRQANEDEIYLSIKPKAMKILMFPHTLCHTVLKYTQNENTESFGRIICRGDLYFKRVSL